LTVVFLVAIFVVFTVFELWRFAGSMPNGMELLGRYILYLIPFLYIQIAPTAAMIAILATYVIKSRQNEIVTWLATGQSVYRLLFPCLLLMSVLGLVNFAIQETVTPYTNLVQDSLRRTIRNKGKTDNGSTKNWTATDKMIVSYDRDPDASDNEQAEARCWYHCELENLTIYQFAADKGGLQAVYRISDAVWDTGTLNITAGEKYELSEAGFVQKKLDRVSIPVDRESIVGTDLKPSQMNVSETRSRLNAASSDTERRNLGVALEKRYATIVLPLVIAILTAPFALGLQRKGRVSTIGYAVGLWFVFVTVSATMEQMGLNGTLPPAIAVWAPLVLFTMVGIYMMSKVRT
jgi:lipopolysaccharide export LptBFGC system permease protein LptF